MSRAHSHYFKDVRHLSEIDVYRLCDLFKVDDPSGATQHALKKLLLPGQRGAGKSRKQDLQEAVDTLVRRIQMLEEDEEAERQAPPQAAQEPDRQLLRSLGYVLWNGGEMPVASQAVIDIVLRDGSQLDAMLAGNICWMHATPPDDRSGLEVIAYRMRGKAPSRIDVIAQGGDLAELALAAGSDQSSLPAGS